MVSLDKRTIKSNNMYFTCIKIKYYGTILNIK